MKLNINFVAFLAVKPKKWSCTILSCNISCMSRACMRRGFLLSFHLSCTARIEFCPQRSSPASLESWWEVCMLIHGQKSLAAPELPHTDMLLWGPLSCCASLELQGLAFSCSHSNQRSYQLHLYHWIRKDRYQRAADRGWPFVPDKWFMQLCWGDIWVDMCLEMVLIWCTPLMSGRWVDPQKDLKSFVKKVGNIFVAPALVQLAWITDKRTFPFRMGLPGRQAGRRWEG